MFDGNMFIETPIDRETMATRNAIDEFWELILPADIEDKDESEERGSSWETMLRDAVKFWKFILPAYIEEKDESEERRSSWETMLRDAVKVWKCILPADIKDKDESEERPSRRETMLRDAIELLELILPADIEDKDESGEALREDRETFDELLKKQCLAEIPYYSGGEIWEGQLSIRNTREKAQSLPFGIFSAFTPRMKAITVHIGEWNESKMKMRQRRLFSADKMYHGENKGKWKNFPCFLEENALQDQESLSDDNCEDKREILKEENEELDKEMNEILQQCILRLNEMHTQRPTQKRQRATI